MEPGARELDGIGIGPRVWARGVMEQHDGGSRHRVSGRVRAGQGAEDALPGEGLDRVLRRAKGVRYWPGWCPVRPAGDKRRWKTENPAKKQGKKAANHGRLLRPDPPAATEPAIQTMVNTARYCGMREHARHVGEAASPGLPRRHRPASGSAHRAPGRWRRRGASSTPPPSVSVAAQPGSGEPTNGMEFFRRLEGMPPAAFRAAHPGCGT